MIFVGPMTKNVVDAVLEFANDKQTKMGLIPSRRQVEFSGGYSNNWRTSDFCRYVKDNSPHIVLERDHAGPGQGLHDDDGYESLREDCSFFDLIHIDPWKKYNSLEQGLKHTVEMISFCHQINPKIEYEVGTEESIKRFEVEELELFLNGLKKKLGLIFNKISFVVIQSGTGLRGNVQTGRYDGERLKMMVDLSRRFGLKSKEHNGDYIPSKTILEKINLGLSAVNIAPEFGLIETQTYLDVIDKDSFESFWSLCYESERWKKWVDKDFNPFEQKENLIKICGHYVISNEKFFSIAKKFKVEEEIKSRIRKKLKEIVKE